MALFSRNPNESAYIGGKKHWTDVIKNSGSGDLLIWRQPEEDFNTNSTLIVMPGEEAIFIKGGVIESVSDNGTHKLSTENYPFISRWRNMATGGISTFNCVVYFVRKAVSMEIKWGTSSPVQVYDKTFNLPATFRARGSYKIQVGNGAKLLVKLLGNNIQFLHKDELENYFFEEFQTEIKSCIAEVLNESTQPLFGVDSRLKGLSKEVAPHLVEILDDYGLNLVNFSISALDLDDEIKQRYKNARLSAIEKKEDALGDKDKMDILGIDWRQQQSADILKTLAANPGSGGIAAAGAGLGMGMAAGNVFAGMAQQMVTPMQPAASAAPPSPSGRFNTKPTEGAAPPIQQGNADDPVATLKKLKEMLDLGLIEQMEFDMKKKEIMSRM
jgi:membrane protease subunit (stomatin/prohibitin family)